MATTLKKMPPPPPIAQNDPIFNHWLHELTAFISSGGGIDPGVIPGYDVLVSTVALHSTQISSNTVNIASNTSNIAVNTSNISSLSSVVSSQGTQISINASNINALYARSQVLNGTAAPAAGTGVNGDWFADTSAKHIYVKVGGSWVLIV